MKGIGLLLTLCCFALSVMGDTVTTPKTQTAIDFKVAPGDPAAYRKQILDRFDAGHFSEASELLRSFASSFPQDYDALPYILLQARSSWEAHDNQAAFDLYKKVSSDQRWRQFTVLPLARIAASLSHPEDAVRFYEEYLANKSAPDYLQVSYEAFRYADGLKRSNDLLGLADTAKRAPVVARLSDYYRAKALLMAQQQQEAQLLLVKLIHTPHPDEAAALALAELDSIAGPPANSEERAFRGVLAYHTWNFGVAKKYLEPLASESIHNSFTFGRALYLNGEYEAAAKAFAQCNALWPSDPLTDSCRSQYANVMMRISLNSKQPATAAAPDTPDFSAGRFFGSSAYRDIQWLRAQSRYEDALMPLGPFLASRNTADRSRAQFLRARIYYQMGRYTDALTAIGQLTTGKSSGIDAREVLFWKALLLEKSHQIPEAVALYKGIDTHHDYFGLLARDKIKILAPNDPPLAPTPENWSHECALQNPNWSEDEIRLRLQDGDTLSPLLFLHLYPEAWQRVVSSRDWNAITAEGKDRSDRYAEMAHAAALGRDYPAAVTYSDRWLKLNSGANLDSVSKETLQILFPSPFRQSIETYTTERKVDPMLVFAIMKQESRFKPMARSQAFARGLMQLIPPVGLELAGEASLSDFTLPQLYEPEVNINLGTLYLKDMIQKFGNRIDVLAASYNGGEDNTQLWLSGCSTDEPIEFLSNIDFSQTKSYVELVRVNYEAYQRAYR